MANLPQEENLDPQDWEATRALAHRMIDDMVDYLRDVRTRPIWQPTPQATRQLAQQPLPEGPSSLEDIYADFQQHILPYTKGNIHPRFFSWVQGTGTLTAALADFMASCMNPNVTIGEHAAMYIDQQVIQWAKEMFGFPASAGGILVSGATMANLTALTVARHAFEPNIRPQGLQAAAGRLCIYCSTETHSCVQKAAELLGIGNEGIHRIAVDADFRINLAALQHQITLDRAAGWQPFCIIGNAGTVNTGAIDPLDELLAISRREGLWFHVDGAFGALAGLTPAYRHSLQAIALADSLAFDWHKWMYLPYEIGCALIRDASLQRAAFALQPNYLLSHERGLAAGPDPIANYGIELSRGFKALKIWMQVREHGIDKYRRLISQNIAQCAYLSQIIEDSAELELLCPTTLNIVCYRYRPTQGHYDTEALNQLNRELLMRLHEQAVATPSYTLLHGAYAIRVCIVNHRTTRHDLEVLAHETIRIGREIAASSTPAAL